MNDDTFRAADADAEALSAYLLGDLSDAEAAALEQRVAHDPDLKARLDALAGALVVLGAHDVVDVPTGFEDRLDARLAAERAAAPADLAAHRARRDRSKLWLGIGTAAAVIAVGSVMAGSMLRSMGGMDTAAQESAGSAGAESDFAAGDAAADGDSGPRAPVILDTNVAIDDEAALRRRYETVPEAQGLIGVPVGDADVLETRFTKAVARRSKARAGFTQDEAVAADPPSASAGAGAAAPEAAAGGGERDEEAPNADEPAQDAAPAPAAPPPDPAPLQKRAARGDPCLAAILAEARGPIVPVRVESVRYEGRRALAYVFVTATPGAEELDRTEVWVVRPGNCATLVFQQY